MRNVERNGAGDEAVIVVAAAVGAVVAGRK